MRASSLNQPFWTPSRRLLVLCYLLASLFPVAGLAAASDLSQQIDELAAAALERGEAPGLSIAVARGGTLLHAAGYGLIDLENQVAATADSNYLVGSITKPFTAIAILQLVEQGKVSLDAKVTDYLPDYDTHGRTITVRNLLDHTSGIPNYTDLHPGERWVARHDHSAMRATFEGEDLYFEPGTSWSYTNSGYYLLGLIAEEVTGESYDRVVESSIARQASLADTSYGWESEIVSHSARGYARDQSGWRNADPISMTVPYAAGAIRSTATDLVRWGRALSDGTLLSPESLHSMATPRPLVGSEAAHGYGLGLFVGELDGHRKLAHRGDIDGFAADFAWYPEADDTVEDDLFIAVLTNHQGARADAVERQVARAVLNLAAPAPKDLPYSKAEVDSWQGSYFLGAIGIHLTELEGKLQLSVDKFLPQPLPLLNQGDGELWMAFDPDIRVSAPTSGAPADRIALQFGDMPILALRSQATGSDVGSGIAAPSRLPRLQALHVAMRDGVRIAIDVWTPEGLEPSQKVPTLMRMTRYWRAPDLVAARSDVTQDANFANADRINRAGYAYVIVDARGTGASFGSRSYETTEDEVRDYGQIVDWIVSQPWSNGRVGSFGVSYDGTTAELLAVNRHPAVRAVAPLYPDFNAFDHLVYPGNVFLEFFTDQWGDAVWKMDHDDICGLQGVEDEACQELHTQVRGVKPVDRDPTRALVAAAVQDHAANVRVAEAARSLEFKDDRFGDGPRFVDRLSSPAWKRSEIEQSGAVIFTRVGWLDAATVAGALSRFKTFSNPQRVVIGALSHGGGHDTDPFRPADHPPDPSRDEQFARMIEFFDPLLRDSTASSTVRSEIRYITLGSGEWHTTSVWPPEGFVDRAFYFAPEGALATDPPTGPPIKAPPAKGPRTTESREAGSDRYQVDATASTGEANRWHTNIGGGDVVYPDRRQEDQKLLTYTTAPLKRDLEITGHPRITLFVSSTTGDAAFFAYLEVVAPDGTVTYVTEGQLRALSRKVSEKTPPYWQAGPYRTYLREDGKLMPPAESGEIEEITFELWPTSVAVPKGHRLRVALAGADAGNFALYPKSGEIPVWSIERTAGHPSHIVLPVRDP